MLNLQSAFRESTFMSLENALNIKSLFCFNHIKAIKNRINEFKKNVLSYLQNRVKTWFIIDSNTKFIIL